MKNIFALPTLFLLVLTISSFGQPYAIGTTTQTFVDGTRNNRSIGCSIFYPATVAGTNTPFVNATFPVIAFGHGFVMTVDAYQNIVDLLVPQGYIVALPTTEGGFSPSHLNFGQDLAFIIMQLKLAHTQSNSMFFQHIAPKAGVMGHSMGGGCAHIAATLTSEINALCTLAPAETNPSAISASQNIAIPSLIIAGANDCITPVNTNQLPMYNAISNSNCKSLVAITGASHCQMANANFNCTFGELTCSLAPTINRSQQHLVLANYITLWFNSFLKDSCSDRDQLIQTFATSSSASTQWQCSSCSLSSNSNEVIPVSGIPNPSKDKLEFNLASNQIRTIQILDLQGKLILEKKESNLILLESIPSGTYIVVLVTKDGATLEQKLIKQ